MKKSKRTKKALSLSLCAMMVISMCQLPTYALEGEEPEQAVVDETSNETTEEAVIEDEKETTVSDQTEETVEKEAETAEEPAEPSVIYPDGVTVEADENSLTGYTAHFVYDITKDGRIDSTKEIKSVEALTSLRMMSKGSGGDEITDHSIWEYVNGDYPVCINPTKGDYCMNYPLTLDEQSGKHVLDLPIVSGPHNYRYVVTYADDTTATVDDPANPGPCRANEANSNHATGDVTWSVVYGKWDPIKQSESPNYDYTTPYDGKKGQVFYVEYEGLLSADQDLGIYLPANYDANRAEPYKVIYALHGGGGNETYWMALGQAGNIMDHIIAENPEQEAIIVSLDSNGFRNNDQFTEDLKTKVIPYMEANYNVSKEQDDRAICGLSNGGCITVYMAFHQPELFRYFGDFSSSGKFQGLTYKEGYEYRESKLHTEEGLQEFYENIEIPEALKEDVIYTILGNYDIPLEINNWYGKDSYETFRDWAVEYLPEDCFIDAGLVLGSHDIYTWTQCLYYFAKDIVWTKEAPVEETYPDGVTVEADENSRTGYTAHFVYDPVNNNGIEIPEGETITGVRVTGSFRLISNPEEVSLSEGSDHSLYEYENGDFVANVHPHTRESGQSGIWGAEWPFDMTYNVRTGKYELDVPMVSGAHYYYMTITLSNGTTIQIDDPANPSPCRDNEANSDSATGDITHSVVYGKWDAEKQSKSPNLDYMTPYEGANKGTLEYVSYKGTINDHQDIGVYLPAGYDANREEPYKVIYLSHGAGGNETYWFSQPQAVNVMDHVIAENSEQEAIIVGMDNTLYGWNYEEIGKNVVNNIIPYIEAHYNVSTDPEDRAFAGFSMGAMTTTYMAFHHADAFGYFGILSGCNIGNATFKEGFEYDGSRLRGEGAAAYLQEVYENIEASEDTLNSLIFTMAGNVDTAVFANGFGYYGAYETIRDWCAEYMPEGNFIDGGLVPGSHDIYTWGQCLYNFAKDVVWTKDVNPDTPDTPDTPNHSVNTGDRSNLSFYVATTCVAVLAAGCILVSKRRKHS